jgi:hypothetical protein
MWLYILEIAFLSPPIGISRLISYSAYDLAYPVIDPSIVIHILSTLVDNFSNYWVLPFHHLYFIIFIYECLLILVTISRFTHMKTTKVYNNFFPSGKGLAIIWEGELSLMYAIEGSFTVWSTAHEVSNPDDLSLFLAMANTLPAISSHGVSQTASLSEVLEDMPDPILGDIYEAIVGYNPFDEDSNSRSLVIEYLSMSETLSGVFGV